MINKEYLINLGIQYYNEFGKLPKYPKESTSNWKQKNGYTGLTPIIDYFGSWQNFIESLSFLEHRAKIVLIGEVKTKKELAMLYLADVEWTIKQFSKDEYINCISDKLPGRLYERLKVNNSIITKLNKQLFADKINNTTPIAYITYTFGYKYCASCDRCMLLDNFYNSPRTISKKSGLCKLCRADYQIENKGTLSYSIAKRNDKIKNTLIPEEREQIIELYQKCPPGYHVDHIKPISKGGTHTLDNLQYLLADENLKKGNRY
jgi:hypothetical protein